MNEQMPYISFDEANDKLYDGKLLKLSTLKEWMKDYSKKIYTKRDLSDKLYPIRRKEEIFSKNELINSDGWLGNYIFLRKNDYSEKPMHVIAGFNIYHAIQYVGCGDIETVVKHSNYKERRSDGKLYEWILKEEDPWIIFFTTGLKSDWALYTEADVIRVVMEQQDREGNLCMPYFKKHGSFLLNKRRVMSKEDKILDKYGNVIFRNDGNHTDRAF